LAIFKYPLRAPASRTQAGPRIADGATEATDYLMLRRERFSYNDSDVPNFYKRSSPGNQQKVLQHPDRVYIAIPPQIATQYSPAYRRADIGVGGVGAMGMMKSMDFGDMSEKLQDAAKSALPEFSTSAVLSMINGFNQFVGLQGQLDINTVRQLQSGQVFNPYSEQMFQGMSFRTHNFAFKFFAKNLADSNEIWNIINYIKIGSLPRIRSGEFVTKYVNDKKKFDVPGGKKERHSDHKNIFDKDFFKKMKGTTNYSGQNRFFEIPDRFQLRFVRFGTNNDTPNGTENMSESTRRDLMFKMYPSVCTGININYTPDNQYQSFKYLPQAGIDNPAIVMTVTFTETRLVTQTDAAAGY
tara:strand:+ start:5287 stop:6351 length:1065 start_codon:yes stop_codon:yes gene_type:complete